MPTLIKVMIVDDTVIYRKILKDVVSSIDNTEVIGTAPNGDLALKKIKLGAPDLILLDVEMPVMDGLTTLKALKKEYPNVGVIMVSGINERQADITMEALSNGALDFVAKPTGSNFQANFEFLKKNLTPIIRLFQTKKAVRSVSTNRMERSELKPKTIVNAPVKPRKPIPTRTAAKPTKFDVVVVGVSTGGPNALAKFIPYLPDNLNIPILLVQHMPPMFTKSLANHLNMKSKVKVVEAEDKNKLEKNQVTIAPGGKHMVLRKDGCSEPYIAIIDTPPVNSCKPSVDVLFKSISNVFKGNILSLIMTGMGSDGMEGVRYLKRLGTYSITQSADTCVVYGMPRAVDEAQLSDESIPLNKLAERVTELVKNGLK